jgi:capsule polysaccharide export protein KpsE/RkpR
MHMSEQVDRRSELQREREEAQAELDKVRADSTGSQQFAMPKIRDLIQRIQDIDRELEQIELAIELERQLDS